MKIIKPAYNFDDFNQDNNNDIKIKKFEPTTKRKTFHEIIRPMLTMAQCFGLLPVMGIRSATPKDLTFTFVSFRILQCIIILIGIIALGATNFMQLLTDGYTFSLLTVLLYIKLAYYWPKLMQEWALIEYHMSVYPPSFNLYRRFYIIATIILTLAALEHALSICSSIVSIGTCFSHGSDLQAYFEIRFVQVFNRTPFAYWKGILCHVINFVATFAWSFIDVFLIMMSLGLTELFQRITLKIKNIHLQRTHESIWRNIREDFNKVTSLCRLTNDTISDLVLLSYTNNLWFICAQILHSISPMKHITDVIYFFYSMLFLVARTLFLTLMISKVHESSRNPLQYLYQVPGCSYCLEIGRFIQQITAEIIALTGMNFFAVRKEMVLSVAGTIITYELVLIQFNAQDGDENVIPPAYNISDTIILPPCTKYLDN
ncbi:gustatory receptor for sugar taste 64f-like [Chrysoperla carnea]|uniref:gustatory receptor for sugar taste 64f-like n=1 Tax=Chrysoperla carnea TaxID=189513 RepID=UPI001D09039E|nr:gustatory receptor for sugar taste 64f-like [Chrysoperla carnea]